MKVIYSIKCKTPGCYYNDVKNLVFYNVAYKAINQWINNKGVTMSYTRMIHDDSYNKFEIISNKGPKEEMEETFARIKFQSGLIKEHGINGCFMEDLLNIVITRLGNYQKGDFRCRENAFAITHIKTALAWLNRRTTDRISRGKVTKNAIR